MAIILIFKRTSYFSNILKNSSNFFPRGRLNNFIQKKKKFSADTKFIKSDHIIEKHKINMTWNERKKEKKTKLKFLYIIKGEQIRI